MKKSRHFRVVMNGSEMESITTPLGSMTAITRRMKLYLSIIFPVQCVLVQIIRHFS
jgi:hypothetical protein